MDFFSLLLVATMPVLQVLVIGLLGAFLASGYSNILTPSALKDINKIVYMVFTPALVFVNFAEAITLQDIISWWYMPVNIGITFLIGGVLGLLVVKIFKPQKHLEGLVIANCSAGNLGGLLLIIIPAICNEDDSPFGDHQRCHERGLSYVALSMSLGGVYIWTHTYSLMQKDGALREKMQTDDEDLVRDMKPRAYDDDEEATGDQTVQLLASGRHTQCTSNFLKKLKRIIHQLVEELTTPPIVAVVVGFIVGVIPWLKSLMFGDNAPLRVLQESITLLGNGLIPCILLILGGNLTRGLGKVGIKPPVIAAIIVMRYVVLPVTGMGVIRAARELSLLPQDPLFAYVLMIQFTLPPAMSIGTMAQLFDVGQEECSVIFLWTYLAATLAVTIWSTVFMWVLS